jgi:hypothetical protein
MSAPCAKAASGGGGVAGKDDGLAGELELECEALGDRRVHVAQRRHLDVARGHDRTLGVFVYLDELAQVGPALVDDAGVDVELVGIPKALRQRCHAGGSVGVDRRMQPARPRVVHEQPELGIVVGMVMGDEGVAQGGQRKFCLDQLEGRAIAGIDDVRDVIPNDQIGGRARRVAGDARPAARPQQHQAVGPELAFLGHRRAAWSERGGKRDPCACRQQVPARDHLHSFSVEGWRQFGSFAPGGNATPLRQRATFSVAWQPV